MLPFKIHLHNGKEISAAQNGKYTYKQKIYPAQNGKYTLHKREYRLQKTENETLFRASKESTREMFEPFLKSPMTLRRF